VVRAIKFKNTTSEFEEDIRVILEGLEAGVHHEFVRLMELEGYGPERKEGSVRVKSREGRRHEKW
jgi:hypothetical protein